MSAYRLAFEVRGELPLLPNRTRWAHWSRARADAKRWEHLVRCHARPRPKLPLARARVTLTRMSSRRPDPDGLVGSFKVVLDGLVKAGVLADDTHDVIGMPDYQWEKAGGKNRGIAVEVQSSPKDGGK